MKPLDRSALLYTGATLSNSVESHEMDKILLLMVAGSCLIIDGA